MRGTVWNIVGDISLVLTDVARNVPFLTYFRRTLILSQSRPVVVIVRPAVNTHSASYTRQVQLFMSNVSTSAAWWLWRQIDVVAHHVARGPGAGFCDASSTCWYHYKINWSYRWQDISITLQIKLSYDLWLDRSVDVTANENVIIFFVRTYCMITTAKLSGVTVAFVRWASVRQTSFEAIAYIVAVPNDVAGDNDDETTLCDWPSGEAASTVTS